MQNGGYTHTLKKIRESLKLCGLEYIDLYLLHSPIGGPLKREECWKACVEAKNLGLVKSIGVSNWSEKHILELEVKKYDLPVLNQVDLHPFMRRHELVAFCESRGILLEAWAPLVRAMRFDHPVVQKVAKRTKKQPAQVLIRWSLQMGFIPIPKSVNSKRIRDNADVFDFELTKEEMDEVSAEGPDCAVSFHSFRNQVKGSRCTDHIMNTHHYIFGSAQQSRRVPCHRLGHEDVRLIGIDNA